MLRNRSEWCCEIEDEKANIHASFGCAAAEVLANSTAALELASFRTAIAMKDGKRKPRGKTTGASYLAEDFGYAGLARGLPLVAWGLELQPRACASAT